jgi:hypothetical protein
MEWFYSIMLHSEGTEEGTGLPYNFVPTIRHRFYYNLEKPNFELLYLWNFAQF